MSAPTVSRHCGFHHTDVSLCPPPELSDVLDLLRADRVPIVISAAVPWLDECGGCGEPTSDWPSEAPIATVWHTAVAGPAALRYVETSCAGCLPGVVSWHRRHAATFGVDVPVSVGMVTVR